MLSKHMFLQVITTLFLLVITIPTYNESMTVMALCQRRRKGAEEGTAPNLGKAYVQQRT